MANGVVIEGGSLNIEQAVLSGELELGGSLLTKDPQFAFQPFCDAPLDALLPVDHPLAAKTVIGLEELADTPFLLYQRSFVLKDRLLQACQQLVLRRRKADAAVRRTSLRRW